MNSIVQIFISIFQSQKKIGIFNMILRVSLLYKEKNHFYKDI